jgi:preprotein translocase subunit SecB
MEKSEFQFKGYFIKSSSIDLGIGKKGGKLSLNFIPKGKINTTNSSFELDLLVEITEANNAVKIIVNAIGNFKFSSMSNELDNFFYISAPAILFPYIRSYITSLSALSGVTPIILPTMNLTHLSEELKNNTEKI